MLWEEHGKIAGDRHDFVATAICGGRYFACMLTIRIAGSNLVDARRLLGWSRYELARRSGVNHRTLKSYELAGDIAPASVGTLTRVVDALEDAGVEFGPDGVRLEHAAPTRTVIESVGVVA